MPSHTKPLERLCLFACCFKNKHIPEYIKVYLQELSKNCSQVYMLNPYDLFVKQEHDFLKSHGIDVLIQPNLGHDFGSWWRALEKIDPEPYSQLILANDSCLLIQPLTNFFAWLDQTQPDFGGLINSNESDYHIQSYFTAYNKKGWNTLLKKFRRHGIVKSKRKIIKRYEIGLTQLQVKSGNQVSTLFHIPASNTLNPLYHHTEDLLSQQLPLVKRQLAFGTLKEHDHKSFASFGLRRDPDYVQDLIVRNSKLSYVNWQRVFEDPPLVH